MPDQVYPDLSNDRFDIKYAKRKVLSSDLKAFKIPGTNIITRSIEIDEGDPDLPGIDSVLSVEQLLTADREIDFNGFNLALKNIPEDQTGYIIYIDPDTKNIYMGIAPSGGSGGSGGGSDNGDIPNLQEVTDVGNTTTNDITANNITSTAAIDWESGTGGTMGILGATSVGSDNYGVIQFGNDANAFQVHLYTNALTGTHQQTLQNADGEITLNENPNYAAGTQTNGYVITLVSGVPTWQPGGGSVNIYNSDGSLTGNRVLTNNGFELKMTRAGGNTLYLVNTTNGNAVNAESDTGFAVYGLSGSSGAVGRLQKHNSSNTTDETVLDLVRGTSGTPTAGIGARIDWYVQSLTGLVNGAKTIVRYTDVTAGNEGSDFEIHLQKGASLAKRITFSGQGFLKLEPITVTAASAITPAEGMILFVSNTDATFTSIGLWCYENGAWSKK